MGEDGSWSLLGHLKRTVKKIRFLLSFDVGRLHLSSILGGVARHKPRRRLSFDDRKEGLRVCTEEDDEERDGSVRQRRLERARSYASAGGSSFSSSDGDVDRKADMFIANFYRQLRLERQISLELRYYRRGNSFESSDESASSSSIRDR
ncbi:uncharacterized protein LOC131150661 [Malania oleifera]|uniref:uncharacterized protein LOC131150661 n=1 Tax=Malania oleifera TaxID=397392 RepID=UPI0025AE256F|nr:uncharacterized protein LOC131150661 [Malania oleifera]